MAWVPPHRRNQSGSWSSSSPTSSSPSTSLVHGIQYHDVRDIQNYYWRLGEEDKDKPAQFPDSATLNASGKSNDELAYLLLFHDANPRWESDKIVFVKSNLDLLPGYNEAQKPRQDDVNEEGVVVKEGEKQASIAGASEEHKDNGKEDAGVSEEALAVHAATEDAKVTNEQKNHNEERVSETNTTRSRMPALSTNPPIEFTPKSSTPIAVFEAASRRRIFTFTGYYKVEKIALLAPHSFALQDMLTKKWQPQRDRWGKVIEVERDAAGWAKSFSQKWAVVKFVKFEGEDGVSAPDAPVIVAWQESSPVQKKSVNELLAEMRMSDG